MNLTKQSIYSMRMITKLITSNKVLRTTDLAKDLNLGYEYPSKLLNTLSKAGIITAIRGPNGGYKANAITKDVTIGTIAHIVERSIKPLSINNEVEQTINNARLKLFATKMSEVINGIN